MNPRALLLPGLAALALVAAAPQDPSDRDLVERMDREHADETPTPTPAAKIGPGAPIGRSEVTYATLGDGSISGYFARPADGRSHPGVIVIHEWWGLNDNVRAMADRLAGEGYMALAVDLYEGEVASDREGARSLMMASMSRADRLKDNLRQAHTFLEGQGAPRVGSIGWCFGGGWSLQAALLLGDDLDAAVVYYGRVPSEAAELAALEAPVLGIFGALDQGIPVDSVRAFESALAEAGKSASIHVYDGADHAFANPSGSRYNAEAAEDAWAKTVSFLGANLRAEGGS